MAKGKRIVVSAPREAFETLATLSRSLSKGEEVGHMVALIVTLE